MSMLSACCRAADHQPDSTDIASLAHHSLCLPAVCVSRPAGRQKVSGPVLCSWAAGVGHWVPYILNPASPGRRTGCKPNSDHCQLTHFMPCSRIIVVHCRQMGRDRRLPPFQGPVNLGLLNSATPMNGLLSKDTPDLSNNELLLICFGKYNTTTNGGKD